MTASILLTAWIAFIVLMAWSAFASLRAAHWYGRAVDERSVAIELLRASAAKRSPLESLGAYRAAAEKCSIRADQFSARGDTWAGRSGPGLFARLRGAAK